MVFSHILFLGHNRLKDFLASEVNSAAAMEEGDMPPTIGVPSLGRHHGTRVRRES